jgi:hypothetical protein
MPCQSSDVVAVHMGQIMHAVPANGLTLRRSIQFTFLSTDYDPAMATTKTTKGKAPAKRKLPMVHHHYT